MRNRPFGLTLFEQGIFVKQTNNVDPYWRPGARCGAIHVLFISQDLIEGIRLISQVNSSPLTLLEPRGKTGDR